MGSFLKKGTPKWMVLMDNPTKMDDLVPHYPKFACCEVTKMMINQLILGSFFSDEPKFSGLCGFRVFWISPKVASSQKACDLNWRIPSP